MTEPKIPFIDLRPGFEIIETEVNRQIKQILEHGCYVMGPEIEQLENTLAEFVGVKHAISCSSGTDALLMALMALEIKAGEVVLTTPHTFVATAEAIVLAGARPAFVDIDPETYNICPSLLKNTIAQMLKKGEKLRAVIAVDLDGMPADYQQLESICLEYGLDLIQDAAQSFGAEYQNRRCCSMGTIAATSFYPSKPLGCYGDGGMSFTDCPELAAKMRSIRVHGQGESKYENIRLGLNARMDTIQAGILLAKWTVFVDELEHRQLVAKRYQDLISETGLLEHLSIPSVPHGLKSSWAQYTLYIKNGRRDFLRERISELGVPSGVYYPIPLHLQQAFSYLGYQTGDFPVAEDCANSVLSLPFSPYMTLDTQRLVVKALAEPP